MTETKTQESEAKKPEDSKRQGALEAAIWKNEGSKGAFHTVSIKRNYKDERGEWRSTNTFRDKDLPDLQKLATWAESRLEKLQDKDREGEKSR
jgi:hypothetical protein